MKTIDTSQEILLFTNTTFSAKEWARNEDEKGKGLTQKEKLEDACWNGLLPEILPEISETANDPKLILWQVNAAANFLDLRFSYSPVKFEREISINPYLFIDTLCEN